MDGYVKAAEAKSRFGDESNGDELSVICSRLMQILEAEAEGYEDVYAWGAPSECNRIIESRAIRRTEELLQEFGLTATELEARIKERVDGYWLYKSGLLTHVGDLAHEEGLRALEMQVVVF